jgi:hypothetical protein
MELGGEMFEPRERSPLRIVRRASPLGQEPGKVRADGFPGCRGDLPHADDVTTGRGPPHAADPGLRD